MTKSKQSLLTVPHGSQAKLVEARPMMTNMLGTVSRARPGQPTKRSPAVVDEMLNRISCGESLMAVCQDDHLPGYSTFNRWQMDDATLRDAVDLAYEFHARTFDDVADDILAGGPCSTGDFRRDEARVAHLRWRLGKINRRRFGDKVQVDHVSHQVFVLPGDAIEGEGY